VRHWKPIVPLPPDLALPKRTPAMEFGARAFFCGSVSADACCLAIAPVLVNAS